MNLNYRSTLSELKANVWEERNESDWSIFDDCFIRYDMEKESYLDSLKKTCPKACFLRGRGRIPYRTSRGSGYLKDVFLAKILKHG